MIRYALRNKKKIKAHYDEKMLKRITDSLDEYFSKPDNIKQDVHVIEGAKYPQLFINDAGHTCGIISFHILDVNYKIYRLAFSEFIG